MSGSRISDTLPALHQAAAVICASSGLTIHQVAALIGMSLAYTKNILGHARRLGLVGCVQSARREVKWHAPEKAAEILAAQKDSTAQAKKERRRIDRQKSQARARGRDVSDWQWRELSDKPERVSASVDAPLPFVLRAPNSVFALGATA